MGAEYERKYRADEACQRDILQDHPGHWARIHMQTTYYDTPSGSLSARGYMLRRRQENGVSVCTLKTAGQGYERGEWEVKGEHIIDAVSELCKLGGPAALAELCREGLVPICGAEFIRQARLLELPAFTAELALDQGSLFSGKKAIPLWELELELKSGSKAALDAFAEAFAANYGLQGEEKSKFARALCLYKEV